MGSKPIRNLVKYLDLRPGWRAFVDPFLLKIWNNPERLAFQMHRITGVITAFFLFFHLVFTNIPVRQGWEAWLDEITNLQGVTPISVLFYLGLGAVLFHGINGIRLILVEALALGIGKPEKPKPPYIAPSLRGFQRTLIHLTFAAWIILWLALGYVLFLT